MNPQTAIALVALALGAIVATRFVVAHARDQRQGPYRARVRREVRKNFLPQKILTIEEFARIERIFPNLIEVIVVCHMVENPNASLRQAVLDNFKQGVIYRFCVSQSNFAAVRKVYTGYFEDIFGIAKAECASDPTARICALDLSGVFSIDPLRREWTSWPYVFFVHVDAQNENAVSAYRGDQEREGIADHYVQLQPAEAKAILNAVNMATDETHDSIEDLVDTAIFVSAPTVTEAA